MKASNSLPFTHMTDAQLKSELERCLYCAEKPCLQACPSHCSPADFIMAARGFQPSDFKRASLEILKQNPLGHVCGVVCPDTFCVDACSRKLFDHPIQIPRVQASILEKAKTQESLTPPPAPPLNDKRIAIIGAGPAGLAASAWLAQKGYEIDLYEIEKKAGGAARMIPDLRLPKAALDSDIDFILSLGKIHTHFETQVDRPEDLLLEHVDPNHSAADAVLVALGEPDSGTLGIPGEKHAVSSIEYLKNPKNFRGSKKVAIFGGGAVAADCAITAKLNGASHVEMFVRRTFAEMPLTEFERNMLLDYGIDITTRTRPTALLKTGKKICIKTVKTESKAHSSLAKTKLQDIPNTTTQRPGFDLVVLAIGTQWQGTPSKQKAIFYAGDCQQGSSTVVEAAASGKNAALAIDCFLNQKPPGKTTAPGTRSAIKSQTSVEGLLKLPVNLKTDFFGIPIDSPFLLSAAPATDGLEQMKKAYEAGWSGAVMKTAFDNLPIHIPGNYMVTFGGQLGVKKTHGNADNVSGHPLNRVCKEVEVLRKLYPTRLTLASTGGPVTGHDEADAQVWQSNTRKLENAGAFGVEYSLSCPQGGDGTEGDIVSQNAAITAKVIDWVMQTSQPDVPKLFKLSAAVTSIKPILRAVKSVFDQYPNKKAGITLANSFPVLAFRPRPQARWEEGMIVGMSGEGVLPISYLTLSEASAFGLTISGNGGVMDYRAAANFLALGVKSVQVCTIATHYGIQIIDELKFGLSFLLEAHGLKSINELIGRALPQPVTPFMELTAVKQISSVNPILCESCGNCTYCPYGAISLNKNKHPITDASKCVGCSICVQQCFAQALRMRDRTPAEAIALKEH